MLFVILLALSVSAAEIESSQICCGTSLCPTPCNGGFVKTSAPKLSTGKKLVSPQLDLSIVSVDCCGQVGCTSPCGNVAPSSPVIKFSDNCCGQVGCTSPCGNAAPVISFTNNCCGQVGCTSPCDSVEPTIINRNKISSVEPIIVAGQQNTATAVVVDCCGSIGCNQPCNNQGGVVVETCSPILNRCGVLIGFKKSRCMLRAQRKCKTVDPAAAKAAKLNNLLKKAAKGKSLSAKDKKKLKKHAKKLNKKAKKLLKKGAAVKAKKLAKTADIATKGASKTIHAEKVAQELQEAADKINPALSAAKKSEACKNVKKLAKLLQSKLEATKTCEGKVQKELKALRKGLKKFCKKFQSADKEKKHPKLVAKMQKQVSGLKGLFKKCGVLKEAAKKTNAKSSTSKEMQKLKKVLKGIENGKKKLVAKPLLKELTTIVTVAVKAITPLSGKKKKTSCQEIAGLVKVLRDRELNKQKKCKDKVRSKLIVIEMASKLFCKVLKPNEAADAARKEAIAMGLDKKAADEDAEKARSLAHEHVPFGKLAEESKLAGKQLVEHLSKLATMLKTC